MLDVETLGAALKLAKKGGGVEEGGSGAVIDDSKISSSTTWSSQKIVDTLCPPFTTSGAIVQCTPVANYPLSVQASWGPRQEGSGDPSPDNIRPITGVDSVQVTRCGKNLLDISNMQTRTTKGITLKGITFQLENGGIHVSGTATSVTDSPIFEMFLPSGTYIGNLRSSTFSWLSSASFVVQKADGSRFYYASSNPFTINEDEKPLYWYFAVDAGVNVDEIIYPQIELGSTATPYEPYTGSAAMLTLPETIYGGTVDAVTGEGSEEWEVVEFDGTENWMTWGVDNFTIGLTGFYYYAEIPAVADSADYLACSHLVYNSESYGGRAAGFRVSLKGEKYWILTVPNEILSNTESSTAAVDSWKSYLAAKAAAGTPVTIAYKLATPMPFQATGNQTIPALPGTNTVYTDAGVVTVSGLSDTVETFNALENRIAALEEAAISG